MNKKIAILGSVGIPASYGGFETLVENLARYHQQNELPGKIIVYCSSNNYPDKAESHLGATLRYVALNANGVSSIAYDVVSMLSALYYGSDVILLLGVSGAIALPLIRLVSRSHIITNIDGIEWKRQKWNRAAKAFLHFSEWLAVRYSHVVVADNAAIAEYVAGSYGVDCEVIAYGGDQALLTPPRPYQGDTLPARYAFALCRIEPENNIDIILEAFALKPDLPLVFLGNWRNSIYGRELKALYSGLSHIHLLDPIYDASVLHYLRKNADIYIHGHSAGGTNPSLVEMMHFGLPVFAFDCIFNRCTTDGKAIFFKDASALRVAIDGLEANVAAQVGSDMCRIARERYTWSAVGREYFRLLLDE
ncbi:MAG: glycosyltransferase family 1 protein [Chlorobiaceae bacterium]|nr:glycosyltransferase family 1 protein [Chlorobiaceae bacterium]